MQSRWPPFFAGGEGAGGTWGAFAGHPSDDAHLAAWMMRGMRPCCCAVRTVYHARDGRAMTRTMADAHHGVVLLRFSKGCCCASWRVAVALHDFTPSTRACRACFAGWPDGQGGELAGVQGMHGCTLRAASGGQNVVICYCMDSKRAAKSCGSAFLPGSYVLCSGCWRQLPATASAGGASRRASGGGRCGPGVGTRGRR